MALIRPQRRLSPTLVLSFQAQYWLLLPITHGLIFLASTAFSSLPCACCYFRAGTNSCDTTIPKTTSNLPSSTRTDLIYAPTETFERKHLECKERASVNSRRLVMSNTDSNSAHSMGIEDDWSAVKDPSERRKIQNRNAQRKFSEWHALLQEVESLTYTRGQSSSAQRRC